MKRLWCSIVVACASVMVAAPVMAQSRPLVTEDPETVPAGYILVESGIDWLDNVNYPVTGLKGNLSRFGSFGVSLGVSSIAELQVDGSLYNRLAIQSIDPLAPLAFRYTGDPNTARSFDDLTIGAKVRFVSETESRPALAVRFSTKLPIVGTESGLSTGTTDFTTGLAIAKTVGSVRIAANAGIAILGDPVNGDVQNHLFAYGISAARALKPGFEVVLDLNGRVDTGDTPPPAGTESRALLRAGGRYTYKTVRMDAALLIGVAEQDPAFGFTFGATWVFKAFTVK